MHRLLPEMTPQHLHVPGGSVWMRDNSGLAVCLFLQSWAKHRCSVRIPWGFYLCAVGTCVNEQIPNKCMGRGLYSLSSSFLEKTLDSMQWKYTRLCSVLHSCAGRQGALRKLLPSLLACWQNSLSKRSGVAQQQRKSSWILHPELSLLLHSWHLHDLMASYYSSWCCRWCWFPFYDIFWLEVLSNFQISI